jgi:hypothetical protein
MTILKVLLTLKISKYTLYDRIQELLDKTTMSVDMKYSIMSDIEKIINESEIKSHEFKKE